MALIHCPDCGKEFSDSAKQCPNCGYRYRIQTSQERNNVKQGFLIGILGLSLVLLGLIFSMVSLSEHISIFISIIGIVLICWAGVKLKKRYKNAIIYSVSISVLVLIMLVICIPISEYDFSENDSINNYSETVEQSEQATIMEEEEVTEDIPNGPSTTWKYETKTDPLTDEVSHMANLYSENENYINGGSTPLGICIYCKEGYSPTVMLGLGNWCKFRSEMPLLYYRFDDGEQEQQSYEVTAPNVAVIGWSNWVEKLKNTKKLVCKIELADGSTSTFTFNTSGLKWDY